MILTTLVIGADYTKSLQTCIQSKRDYAAAHGYTFIQGGETYWDRTKPIAWSKIPFLLDVCKQVPEGSLIWQSDADVLITNPDLKLEDHIVPLLPHDKDMLLTLDACGHINSGNILFRNTAWARDFWKRVGTLKQFTYHLWWENAAIIELFKTDPEVRAKLHVTRNHRAFNAYLRGIPDEPLWEPGDFLVHFAGIYDLVKMEELVKMCMECQPGTAPRIQMGDQEIQACAQSREESLRWMNQA